MNLSDSLRDAARRVRALALAYDVGAAAILERGFQQWQADTLMPQAVNRWIAEIGEGA